MVHKDMIVTAINKESAAEISYVRGRFYPARRFRVEFSQLLQRSILRFRQEFNAHRGRHVNGVAGRIHPFLLPRRLTFAVVASIPALFGTFC